MIDLIEKVEQWGIDKGFVVPENSYKQFAKLVEEVAEVGTALNNNDMFELIDAIGDSMVVLILLAKMNGLKAEQCLEVAYDEIKGRTGKTVNGVFIKD